MTMNARGSVALTLQKLQPRRHHLRQVGGDWFQHPVLSLPALARRSSLHLPRRLPCRLSWVINALRVGLDLRQCEPRRFEFAFGVKRGLIEVMRRRRIGALAEDANRTRLRLRPELHHADIRIAVCAVTPLAPFHL